MLEGSAWDTVGSVVLFAAFWNAIVMVFIHQAWLAPMRIRRLLREGNVTIGRIVSRRSRRHKGMHYYATFQFQEPGRLRDLSQEVRLPDQERYELAEEGKEVTVLYDRRKPKKAIAYELCHYTVKGATPRAS